MLPRISFYTFGCRLNQSETAVIQNSFAASGYKVVDFTEPADVVVVNTCTVTENGDSDTRRLVHKINRKHPSAQIALIGCQAQIQKEQLASLPNVRWVVGNAKKFELASIFKNTSEESTQVITPTIPRDTFTVPVAGIDRQHTRANLKIQDGCDFFCSFCEIPYARGRARSREFDDIIKESKILIEAGHKELILTGINLGTYRHEQKCFLDVIEALEKMEKLERIRISSIEPTTIPHELFDRMGKTTKLCRYLHIPLQSGSDQVLESMKRKYTTDEFQKFILEISAKISEICLGTDVIVGFPGETEECFEETVQFLRELPFDYFHVFSYSERTMAKSQNLSEPIAKTIINQRSRILRELSARKRRMFYESLLGTEQKVLFEQKKNGVWKGVTDHYAKVHVDSEEPLTNQMRWVRMEGIQGESILGTLLELIS